ncbi:Erg28p [Ascoidea rubescens DSM 1968]|uniref:Erg28-like protein n=1 Tax=Ascoidea rubescens DSM 1968 TaxID=1344418 RepID=A0A1D2VB20_9ASCO|nr:Erg28-like protein [Ascoidea rubescens DSM 1968]ODV58801.1 Erg28-like protein [Ascoidea rubescens DSM 1968]
MFVVGLIQDQVPKLPGYLPKWLFFIAIVSIFNSVQTYFSGLTLTRRVYENKPLETTNLSARTFGTWTMLSAIIRYYGSFNLNNAVVWKIVLSSYLIAFVHFNLELLVYKTAKLGKGFAGPLIVSTVTISWMLLTRDYYLSL